MGKFRIGDAVKIKGNNHPIFSKYENYQGVIDKIGGNYTVTLRSGPNQASGLPIHKNTPVMVHGNNQRVGLVKKRHSNGNYTVSIGGDGESTKLHRRDLQVLYNSIDIPKNVFRDIASKPKHFTGGATINVNDLLCSNLCKTKNTNSPLGKANCPQRGWRKLAESRKCLKKATDYNDPNSQTCCNTYKTAGCYDLCVGKGKWDKGVAPLGKTKVGWNTTRQCFLKQRNPYTGQEEANVHNCKQYNPAMSNTNITPPVVQQVVPVQQQPTFQQQQQQQQMLQQQQQQRMFQQQQQQQMVQQQQQQQRYPPQQGYQQQQMVQQQQQQQRYPPQQGYQQQPQIPMAYQVPQRTK